MPSTENATLQRIQQEINESIQREKELRRGYSIANGETTSESNGVNGYTTKPILQRAQSAQALNSHEPQTNGFRRFTPNPNSKGMMQRFIKSRGKLTLSPLQTTSPPSPWTNGDVVEPARVTVEPGKRIRNGYVPVEQRMKQEVIEYRQRESELRSERRKSQPDLMALLDVVESPRPERRGMRAAKSVTQLYDPDELPEDTVSAPSSLKPARSLAQLIDAPEEAIETPGTHSLILQFERINQKNGQARA